MLILVDFWVYLLLLSHDREHTFHERSLMMVGSGVVQNFYLSQDHEHSDKC